MRSLFWLAFCFIMVVSCKSRSIENKPSTKNTKAQLADTIHTSQNSLDWEGHYEGLLPCSDKDCSGIKTTLKISYDLNFEQNKVYLGQDKTKKTKGTFKWSKDGGEIFLYSEKDKKQIGHYKVGENQLIDLKKNVPDNDRDTDPILRKSQKL